MAKTQITFKVRKQFILNINLKMLQKCEKFITKQNETDKINTLIR